RARGGPPLHSPPSPYTPRFRAASVDGSAEAELSTCVELLRAGVDTGLLRCADGVVHRPTAAHLCQSFLPRPAPDFSLPEDAGLRAEEHTSELQSREKLVCRPLL